MNIMVSLNITPEVALQIIAIIAIYVNSKL